MESALQATGTVSIRRGNARHFLVMAAIVAGIAVVPLVLDSYTVRFATTICMYLALAHSWNLIGGYAGLLSLAHPTFFGTGAVAATIMVLNGLPLAVAGIGGIVVAVAIAAAIGVPTLRLQGHYFVVATLLITEAVRNFVLNLDAFGFNGGIAANIINNVGLMWMEIEAYNMLFFYVMAGLAGLSMLVVWCFERSRWGLALRALRDNEKAAAALGIATARVKTVVFMLSGALAAAVGVVWAFWIGTVEANEAYNLAFTFEVIVMVFLGGRGTLWGPVFGVAVILTLNEFIGVDFAEVSLIVLGVIIMLVVLFQPDGLSRIFRDGPKAFAPKTLAANFRRYRVR